MGFFSEADVRVEKRSKGVPSARLLHDLGCAACSLNHAKVHSPKMKPTGNPRPEIYILGEAPGEEEDKRGEQFTKSGASGGYLRSRIPHEWLSHLMWDNVVRDRPPDNRTPEMVEIECCRKLVTASIEAAQPKAIFGFGGVPLAWATGEHLISNWRGRKLPVRIGKHTCWYFAFNHPAYLLHLRSQTKMWRTDNEHIFDIDLKRAFESVTRLPEPEVHSKEAVLSGVESVLSCSHEAAMRVVSFLREASQHKGVAGVDFEGSGLRPYASDYRLASIAIAAHKTMAFSFDHTESSWSTADRDLIIDAFLAFLHAEAPRKTVHNLSHELEVIGELFGHEHVRAGMWEDSISQAFVLDQRESAQGRDEDAESMECYGLGFLTLLYFGIDIKPLSGVDRRKIMQTPLNRVLPYNGVDAKYHKLLFNRQQTELRDMGLLKVYEMHLPRVATCVLTQLKGIPLDFNAAHELDDRYKQKSGASMAVIQSADETKRFFQKLGHHFNPGSDRDAVIMCRDIIGSKAGARTDKFGKVKYSADKKVLTEIGTPFTKSILEWRGVAKLASTYVFTEASPVVWPDGMLHPILNHARARTSRLTCIDPNGQNFPKRQDGAKEVRRQICARLEHLLLSLDYGQIEARVFAMASKDKNYIAALWEDFDIHSDWSRRIAYVFPHTIGGVGFINDKDVMKKMREKVKGGWVFALFFDAQLATACAQVGIEENAASRRLESEFWQQFPGVLSWKKRVRDFYEKNGYVELLTGRRRYGPMKANAVINTPIQGTACEIVVDGMNRVSQLDNWEAHPILQIHDDLLFHLPQKKLEVYAEPIIAEMIRPTFDFINVPLMAEMSVGENWYEMKDVAKFKSSDWYGGRAPEPF